MISSPSAEYQNIIEKVYAYKQDQVFKFWDELTESEKVSLLNQLKSIDFELMAELIKKAKEDSEKPAQKFDIDVADIISLEARKQQEKKAKAIGEDILSQGKVAAFLVSGGQGTRLGYDGPKGMFPVTPVKKKSLFQLHAEKLLATGKKYNQEIPWFIMTSETNHEQTVEFFEQNKYFGYGANIVDFFKQEMIPAIDNNGKFILDQKNHVFTNPNGHGGSISALWKSGAIENMQSKGIEYIFYFQVDNVLTRICDPAYLGYHILHNSEMSNKVVRKAFPEEKMGIICKINGKTGLVEYSDLPEKEMYEKDTTGNLKYWAGSIATHVFNVEFIVRENKSGFKLPFHIAKKKIPYIDENGKIITPEQINGIKFESFVFDALLDTQKSISLEVERAREFSPLKNAEGFNSPQTVKQDLNNIYGSWLENIGIDVPRDAEKNVKIDLEISPFYALRSSDMENKNLNIEKAEAGLYLE